MRMIEITALENGSHRNQTHNGVLPEGWAVIPDDMDTPSFPFGDIIVEEINGTPTVTAWVPGVLPEPAPVADEPSPQDDTDAMLIDHEYRLTLLELGLTE